MHIRTKKLHNHTIIRSEASGDVKEVVLREDFMRSNDDAFDICFRGRESSGVVELSRKEAENLCKEISSKLKRIKPVKIMKFSK